MGSGYEACLNIMGIQSNNKKIVMRKMYLFGDLSSNFSETVKPFIKDSGSKDSIIALLISGEKDWENHLENYINPIKKCGVKEINVIIPENDGFEISPENLDKLNNATGIFIGGGNTSIYKKIYCSSEAGEIIKQKYFQGIPYAGLSAGAIITAEKFFNPKYGEEVYNGFGFLPDTLIEPHFIEQSGFKELMSQFRKISSTYGLGIDESTCLKIVDETLIKVIGSTNCYYFKKKNEKFSFTIYKGNDEFCL